MYKQLNYTHLNQFYKFYDKVHLNHKQYFQFYQYLFPIINLRQKVNYLVFVK